MNQFNSNRFLNHRLLHKDNRITMVHNNNRSSNNSSNSNRLRLVELQVPLSSKYQGSKPIKTTVVNLITKTVIVSTIGPPLNHNHNRITAIVNHMPSLNHNHNYNNNLDHNFNKITIINTKHNPHLKLSKQTNKVTKK